MVLGLVFSHQAASQVVRRGKCPNLPSARKFDIHKMTGVWYLQYLYFACAQVGIKCSVFNMTVVEYEGRPAMAFHERSYDETTGQFRTRDSLKILNPDNPAVSVNRVSSACHNDTLNCTYVSTGDNYDYFINYCCKAYKTDFRYESLGIRTRVKRMTPLLQSRIWFDLTSKGIGTEFAYPIDQDCLEDPPDQ